MKRILVIIIVLALGLSVSAQQTCPDENHPHAIDLGLPSGTKWACCNVGASTPLDYGVYYAWGETQTGKRFFDLGNYQWIADNLVWDIGYSKYWTRNQWRQQEFFVDYKSVLEYADDAARLYWGGDWHMPTREDFEELLDNTTSQIFSTEENEAGLLFTASNGNRIFLIAAGFNLTYEGLLGCYWSSSLNIMEPIYAYALGFSVHGNFVFFINESVAQSHADKQTNKQSAIADKSVRFYGFSIRPVCH